MTQEQSPTQNSAKETLLKDDDRTSITLKTTEQSESPDSQKDNNPIGEMEQTKAPNVETVKRSETESASEELNSTPATTDARHRDVSPPNDGSQSNSVEQDHSSQKTSDLRELIADPTAKETDWMQACHEFEKRNADTTKRWKRLRTVTAVLGAGLILTTIALAWQFSANQAERHAAELAASVRNANAPIVAWDENGQPIKKFDAAQSDLSNFKLALMIRIGSALDKKGLSDAQAARMFNVDQSKIVELLTEKPNRFSTDQLVLWLSALGEDVIENRSQRKRFKDELTYWTKAISEEPEDFGFYMSRAEAYKFFKQYDLAVADLTKANQLEPKRLGPLNNRALLYLETGKLAECIADATKLIRQQPLYQGAYDLRSSAYAKLGKFDLAMKDASKVIDFNPNSPKGYWARAMIYMRMHRNDLAAQDFRKILILTPNDKNAQDALSKTENSKPDVLAD